MALPATIEEEIEKGLEQAKSHRNFNGDLVLSYDSNETIQVPINSIVSKYRDFIDAYVDETPLTDEDQVNYRYSPKKFSYDMYGTTEYWSMILHLNECHSIVEFEPTSIRYIKPECMDDLINEIMILENQV